jgi:hypothetical protein
MTSSALGILHGNGCAARSTHDMCALPEGFGTFVMLDGTHAGKNPRRRELFDASMCGDIR